MGACIGVISLSINKILLDKTTQVSVEPNPDLHEYLYKNREKNKGMFNIEKCIVSKHKQIDFFLGGAAFLVSSVLSGGKKILVPGKTLEALMKPYFEFTVIVMDIEGAELEFLRSFSLRDTKIRL